MKPRPDTGPLDWKIMRREAARILATIRVDGGVRLDTLRADRHKAAALAELEGTGAIRALSAPNERWFVSYEIAPDQKTAHEWVYGADSRPRRVRAKPFVLFDRIEDQP